MQQTTIHKEFNNDTTNYKILDPNLDLKETNND